MKPSCDWCERRRMDYAYLLPKVFPRRVLQPGGGFGWQLPIANSCSAAPPGCAQYREVEQSGKLVGFIPRRSQVQILPSLFASEEALFHESTCREMGAFVMSIFIRRTRHQQATPPRGNTRLSPMVPVGSYLESEVSPND